MTDHFDHTPQVIADLQAAKEYLLENGWCQGSESTSEYSPRVCASTAISSPIMGGKKNVGAWTRGSDQADRIFRAYGALQAVVRETTAPYSVPAWNDMAGRTINEVVNAFDTAIIKLKESHNDDS